MEPEMMQYNSQQNGHLRGQHENGPVEGVYDLGLTMPSRKGQLSKGELGMTTTKVADGNCRVQRQPILFWTSHGRAIQCSA